MRFAHRVAAVRAAEEPLLAAGVPLMARASTALAVEVSRRLPFLYGARVALLVGGGNNGADALWAGAWLARRGAVVVAVLAADPVQDALAALMGAGGRVGTVEAVAGTDVVVDGLVGIGGRGALRPEAQALVDAIGTTLVVAVDVPSGVDADTGAVAPGAVRADVTVTFGALKPGLLIARSHVGDLVTVDLGLGLGVSDLSALAPADVLALLPVPQPSGDKYARGVVGVMAGSEAYPGAAVLAVGGAIRSGAGMVRYVGNSPAVPVRWPEAVPSATVAETGRVQAWVLGPGLGVALEPVAEVLVRPEPVVVDADALTVLAEHQGLLATRAGVTVLTPHAREFARFGAEVGEDRVGAARRLAGELGVHVLLKGDATVVAAPDGRARVNTTGSPYLACAGSGDVLAGVIGGLLAQGLDPLDAASVGAWLHGRAGDLARGSAGALLDVWPAVLRELGAGD